MPLIAELSELSDQELGRLSLGTHELTVGVELWEAGDSPGIFPWLGDYWKRKESAERELVTGDAPERRRVLSRATLRWTIEVVPSIEAALPPVSSPGIDTAVARSLAVVFRNEYGAPGAFLVATDTPEVKGLGLSLQVKVRKGSEVRDTLSFHPTAEGGLRSVRRYLPLEESLPLDLERGANQRSRWSLRVSGTDEDILSSWRADRRWSGTLLLSLDELVERGKTVRAR